MKFLAFALIALVAIGTVHADALSELTCLMKLKKPCQAGDSACETAYADYNLCIYNNSCNIKTPNSEIIRCNKGCSTSDNATVKDYVQAQNDCLNGTVLSFAGLLLTIFAFVF